MSRISLMARGTEGDEIVNKQRRTACVWGGINYLWRIDRVLKNNSIHTTGKVKGRCASCFLSPTFCLERLKNIIVTKHDESAHAAQIVGEGPE